jgi:hypothetical protein
MTTSQIHWVPVPYMTQRKIDKFKWCDRSSGSFSKNGNDAFRNCAWRNSKLFVSMSPTVKCKSTMPSWRMVFTWYESTALASFFSSLRGINSSGCTRAAVWRSNDETNAAGLVTTVVNAAATFRVIVDVSAAPAPSPTPLSLPVPEAPVPK